MMAETLYGKGLCEMCLSCLFHNISQYIGNFPTCWEWELLSFDAPFLHPGFEGGGIEAQEFGGAFLAADLPAGFFQRLYDMVFLHVLQLSQRTGPGPLIPGRDPFADPIGISDYKL